MNDYTKYEQASQAVLKGTLRRQYMLELSEALKNSAMNDQEKASIFAETLARCYQIDCNIAFQLAYQSEVLDVQAEIAKQSAPFEIARAQNEALKLKAEANFTTNQSELVSAQRKTEVLRRKDIQAGIELKNMQQIAAHIAALKEEDTRRILLFSSHDNVLIKRTELQEQYLKILSEDSDMKINTEEELHRLIKDSIENIGKGSDYTYKPYPSLPAPVLVSVSDDGYDVAEPAIDVQILPSNPEVGEQVRFIAHHSNVDRDLEFEWNITEIAENEPIKYNDFTQHFNTDGYKNVCLLIKERNNAKVWKVMRRIYVAAASHS